MFIASAISHISFAKVINYLGNLYFVLMNQYCPRDYLANCQQITGKLNLFSIITDYQYVSKIQICFLHVSASY